MTDFYQYHNLLSYFIIWSIYIKINNLFIKKLLSINKGLEKIYPVGKYHHIYITKNKVPLESRFLSHRLKKKHHVYLILFGDLSIDLINFIHKSLCF